MNSVVFTHNFAEPLQSYIEQQRPDKLFVLVDDNTERLCLPLFDKAGLQCHIICISHGDDAKNIESLTHVWRKLSGNGATRHSLLICLGGGMVTDLGGFAAATFKRGIDCVNLPTTLLAMVDASVGGKTGINLDSLKNEIGNFKQPSAVIIDTLWLRTLDRQNMLSGYAEMLKHGLLSTHEHIASLLNFDIINPDLARLNSMIERSVEVKKQVVEQDPQEHGLRKALNLGHTLGHAFETWSMLHKQPLPHGYAVAFGLVGELYLSHKLKGFPVSLLEQIVQFIREHYAHMPMSCTHTDELLCLMKHDKKNRAGTINFTLLSDVGQICLDQLPEQKQIIEAIDFCCDAL